MERNRVAAATIQYNKSKSRVNVILDDGEETGWADVPPDGMALFEEDQIVATLYNYRGELESNTVFDLDSLETEIEDDVDEEDDGEEEEIEVEEGDEEDGDEDEE